MEEAIVVADVAMGVGQLAGGVIAAASIVHLLLALWRAARFPPLAGPAKTGICGAEPGIYERLRPLCAQEALPRPRGPTEPAILIIGRVIKKFPTSDLALVIAPGVEGAPFINGGFLSSAVARGAVPFAALQGHAP
jgi:hypothetical protein